MKLLQTILLISFWIGVFANDPVVNTKTGAVKGRTDYSVIKNIPFYSFLDIPYAQAPVGNLRFSDPVPIQPWSGILDGTQNKKICYQIYEIDPVDSLKEFETEDCLILNVFVPKIKKNNLLPVMVWIHGGGFIFGYSLFTTYGPHHYMDQDIIVVSINYRLGPLGFLSTGDRVIPGNFGLKDQNLALKWVRDNIQYFGGDPNKVTILGQSSGAAAVTYHTMSKQSQGLFRAVIAQSGTILSPWSYQRKHREYAYQLAQNINPNFNKNATSLDLLTFLRNVTTRQIYTNIKFPDDLANDRTVQGEYFTPVIESKDSGAFLTDYQYEALVKGKLSKVPLLIGTTSEELIWIGRDRTALIDGLKQIDGNTSLLVNWNMHVTDPKKISKIGNEIRNIYTNGLFQDDLGSAIRYYTDQCFAKGIIHHAKLQSQFSDVYFYIFSHKGPLGNGSRVFYAGAEKVGHSEDLEYQWASVNKTNLSGYPSSEKNMIQIYTTLIANFVKTMNPTPCKSVILQSVIWPKVHLNNFHYLDIDNQLTKKTDPKKETYSKWVQLYEKEGIKPFDTF